MDYGGRIGKKRKEKVKSGNVTSGKGYLLI